MAKSIPVIINQFNGGIVEDKRSGWSYGSIPTTNKFSITKHFDTLTYSHKLVPYAKFVASLGVSGFAVTAMKLTRFLYARTTTATTYRLFGLGDDGTGLLKVFKFDIDGSGNLDTQNWVACTNGVSSAGARSEKVFAYYKSYIYMYQGTTAIARFKVTEDVAFADSWQAIDDSTIGVQPVHHPNDDILYFFGAQKVYSWNDSAFSNVLTLPPDLQIQAACAYGNYLAIACTKLGNQNKKSIVYLWDRDSSLATLTQRIDMGEGTVLHMANLNNKLIVVMNFYGDNAYSIKKAKVLIKTPSGEFGSTLRELEIDVSTQNAADFPLVDFIRNNKLYFPMKITLNGDKRVGIWVVDETGRIAIDQYHSALETSGSAFKGIYATANVWWVSYDDGTGAIQVQRSDQTGVYDTTNASVYETPIFTGGDTSQSKKLLGVTVMTEPIPSGGQVVLKYRKNVMQDGAATTETAWTTIFTHTTVNSISHDAVNIESSGATLPKLNEIQFQINSTGGVVITGLRFAYEIIEDAPYQP